MGSIADKITQAFRDFATDGVASSGLSEVDKSQVRALGPLIEAAIANAGLGALVSVVYSTQALLNADLAHASGSVALVYGDATDANNDLYTKSGASGAGAWTLTNAFHQLLLFAGAQAAVNSVPFATWAALSAKAGRAGDRASVIAADTGTHTDPVTSTAGVKNGGVYQYSTSPAGWQRIADLDSQTAQAAAAAFATARYPFEIRDINLVGKQLIVGANKAVRLILPLGDLSATIAAMQVKSAQLSRYIFEVRDPSLAGKVIFAGAGKAVRAIVGDSAAANSALSQLAAIAGNTASPTARVATVATIDGAPNLASIGKDRLRRVHNLLARLDPDINTETLICNVVLAGDSYTQNASIYSERLAKKLQAKYGAAGPGYISLGYLETGATKPFVYGAAQPPAYAVNGAVLSTYPVAFSGSPTGLYYATGFPDLAGVTFAASGDGARVTFPAGHPVVSQQLLFQAASGAALQWSIDGGTTWATLALDGSAGTLMSGTCYRATVGVPSSSGGTLLLRWASGACTIGGFVPLATKGVAVHKIAATGSSASHWANALATVWEANIALLTPDVFQYMDGPNSQASNYSAATWAAYIQTLLGRVASARASADVLLMTAAENAKGYVPKLSDYALQARKLTLANFIAYRDLQEAFGQATNVAEYKSTGSLPLLSPDDLHPTSAGGAQIFAAAHAMLTP